MEALGFHGILRFLELNGPNHQTWWLNRILPTKPDWDSIEISWGENGSWCEE